MPIIPIHYPHVKRDDNVIDSYHGTLISDPYRWLENINSDEVKNFIKQQNQLTREFVDKCEARHMINARLSDLWTFSNYECPFRRGDCYFYFNDGVLYKIDSLEQVGDEEPVLNIALENLPNYKHLSLSSCVQDKTGENMGDRMISVSPDGSCVAFGVSYDGSVWCAVHFKNLTTDELYPDVLDCVQNTFLSWTLDSKGLFYGKYPDKSTFKFEKIFYHVVGTRQSKDKLIAEFPENPSWELLPKVSVCGEYLIIYALEDCSGHSLVYLAKLREVLNGQTHVLTSLVAGFDANYDYITNSGPVFYFLTNKGAPKGKIVCVNTAKDSFKWKVVLKEHPKDVLDWVVCVNMEFLMTCYTSDVKNILQLRSLSTGSLLHTFPLDLGAIGGHCGRKEDSHFFFKFSSFLTPGIIMHVDLESMDSVQQRVGCLSKCKCINIKLDSPDLPIKVFRESTCQSIFDPNEFTINQIFYPSKDKTKVSMFLVHRKNLTRNGRHPCILCGYGGFNVSLKPNFDPTNIVFIQSFDGIFAVANIRGGGEYGSKWYEDGIGQKKQNCFDDFLAAAEYLIKMRYTRPEKLAIKGDSNGGMLVGVCINQRPDLFGAAIAGFGVMDLLRFHKFTSGTCWISDYGCSDNKSEFENLIKFSPLHNVQLPFEAKYPAVLLITADHDERVVPLHSYKMIAELQMKIGNSPSQKTPLLIRVETNVGHGDGMSFKTAMDEVTDVLSFLMLTLQLTFQN